MANENEYAPTEQTAAETSETEQAAAETPETEQAAATATPETEEDAATEEKESFSVASLLFDAVSVVVNSIMIITVIFTFFFRLVGVNGTSMLNTLQTDDWLLVTPYYSEPKYGDIVISTKKTAAQGSLVKRVIAVAGDEVMIDAQDNVYVNGEKINDSYALKDGIPRGDRTYPITVPEDCVMLMGDNRIVSWDSRYESIGFAEQEHLLGKAQLRVSRDWNIYANFPG